MERFIADRLVRMRMKRRLEESYEGESQDELIQKAKSGDSRAFEKLLADNEDLISMMSKKYFLKSGDYEDSRQLANIAFWDAVSKYDTNSNGDFRAFAGMIIKRKFTDEIRKENTDSRLLNISSQSMEDTVASDGEGGEATLGDTIPAKGLNPEERYLGREGARNLIQYMRDNLSSQEMKAIKLYIKGMKVSKISEVTGMPYKSVENAIRRVKGKILDYMRTERQTESKKLEESENIFSDEEKEVLGSVIRKLELQESIKESLGASKPNKLRNLPREIEAAKEDFTNLQEEIKSKEISQDSAERYLKALEDRLSLLSEDEDLTDEQYGDVDELLSSVRYTRKNLDDLYPEEEEKPSDPYRDLGLRRSDFY